MKVKQKQNWEIVKLWVPVDQLVGAMLNNYLEENPKDAKTLVQKVILAAKKPGKLQVRLER